MASIVFCDVCQGSIPDQEERSSLSADGRHVCRHCAARNVEAPAARCQARPIAVRPGSANARPNRWVPVLLAALILAGVGFFSWTIRQGRAEAITRRTDVRSDATRSGAGDITQGSVSADVGRSSSTSSTGSHAVTGGDLGDVLEHLHVREAFGDGTTNSSAGGRGAQRHTGEGPATLAYLEAIVDADRTHVRKMNALEPVFGILEPTLFETYYEIQVDRLADFRGLLTDGVDSGLTAFIADLHGYCVRAERDVAKAGQEVQAGLLTDVLRAFAGGEARDGGSAYMDSGGEYLQTFGKLAVAGDPLEEQWSRVQHDLPRRYPHQADAIRTIIGTPLYLSVDAALGARVRRVAGSDWSPRETMEACTLRLTDYRLPGSMRMLPYIVLSQELVMLRIHRQMIARITQVDVDGVHPDVVGALGEMLDAQQRLYASWAYDAWYRFRTWDVRKRLSPEGNLGFTIASRAALERVRNDATRQLSAAQDTLNRVAVRMLDEHPSLANEYERVRR